MDSLINLQQRLLPDLLETMQKRYQILHYIRLLQPIGRRGLSTYLETSERVLRGEVTFLKDQTLVEISTSGMHLTDKGLETLVQLEQVMKEIQGLRDIEKRLKDALMLNDVVVVAGNSDDNDLVKKEIGRACSIHVKKCLQDNNIIAVTGGTTMADAAEMMSPIPSNQKVTFVPARGGLGENVKNQANTIVAKMAEQAQREYRLLHVPDQVSMEAYNTITKEPAVKEVLQMIQSATIVIHGIGDAMTMAKRRNTPTDIMKQIENEEAVAEAFGYYFNKQGEVVCKVNTVGLQLENVREAGCVVVVAGGESKAKAIQAYMMNEANNMTLITDEGAALALLKDLEESNKI